MNPFTDIVSLGYRCRVARRLRDHYGTAIAYPFDWWITPIEGAVRFLHDWDVDALYRTDRLALTWRWGFKSYVRNRDYGITLAHEFPLDTAERVRPGWRALTANPKSRTTALMKRFRLLNRPSRRVLFVRDLAPGEERIEACTALREAVMARADPPQATFLLISRNGFEAPGWLSLRIDDRSVDWQGDPALWDPALASLGFKLKKPADEAGLHAYRKAMKRAKRAEPAAESTG